MSLHSLFATDADMFHVYNLLASGNGSQVFLVNPDNAKKYAFTLFFKGSFCLRFEEKHKVLCCYSLQEEPLFFRILKGEDPIPQIKDTCNYWRYFEDLRYRVSIQK